MPARAPFHASLEMLRIDVDAIGAMAQEAVAGALTALVGGNRVAASEVVTGDNRLDALFVALEERAYTLVAQQAPVATDLRFLMSTLRVLSDYEKTGDRAVAVAKIALEDWDPEGGTLTLLGRMGDLSLEMVGEARRAWLDEDLAIAVNLKRRDEGLDALYRDLLAHLLEQQGPGASRLVLHAHAAGRSLERIADHAVMIGERVSYLITGDPSALAAEIA